MNAQRKFTDVAPLPHWRALALQMANGNAILHFLMGFREHGTAVWRHAKTVALERAISWMLNTMLGDVKPGKELTIAFYCSNPENRSTWAVFDSDDHSGISDGGTGAGDKLLAALRLIEPDTPYLYEHSGRGTHLFLFAESLVPCSEWIERLGRIADAAGVTIGRDGCEIRPASDSLSNGLAMRSPVSFNPATGTFSEIIEVSDNFAAYLAALEQQQLILSFAKKEKENYTEETPRQGRVVDSDTAPFGAEIRESSRFRGVVERWLAEFAIAAHERHNELCRLTGHIFNQTSKTVALHIVRLHYAAKTVPTNATAAEHEAEFEDLWQRLIERWTAALNTEEAATFCQLRLAIARCAFRIIRSWYRAATLRGETEFPIALQPLGDRLGVTPQYAGRIVKEFADAGILSRIRGPVAGVKAAVYTWRLCEQPVPACEIAPRAAEESPIPYKSPTAADIACISASVISVATDAAPNTPAPAMTTACDSRNPLAIEGRVVKALTISPQSAISLERLFRAFDLPLGRLELAIHRLTQAAGIELLDGIYRLRTPGDVARSAIRFLASEARCKGRVDIMNARLIESAAAETPKLLVDDLRQAFESAIEAAIINRDGTPGPFIALGTADIPTCAQTMPKWRTPRSKPYEMQRAAAEWLERYSTDSRCSW